ncbi:NAD(P)-dependent alcohol dehydrogenase [Parendozoicomonas sp. Alg238-R29]|uniref:NADPH-dependent aldehyde reductase Ahr n=1 Tax=Parendozoicomonas sp. Alg238-R29 TaxID=2993446 RepID=UPI00248EC234|nr:NAD(P)-dependent alcohol dehydrogenase [Parendozoicomonas sp. Alg238-R29]
MIDDQTLPILNSTGIITVIKAYTASQPGGKLEAFEYDPGPLGDGEVELAVESCGICHSDLSMLNNEWGITQYPFVAGHEVIGKITATGANVSDLKTGQNVGLGWHSDYCHICHSCMSGDHNLCSKAQPTIAGRHGGFADKVRADASAVVALPEGLNPKTAGPLFCGGITVFNPLVQFDIPSTAKVAVIGIGGLGHLALQFLNAWGCEVTAFTSSEAKQAEALEMGAHKTLNSRSKEALSEAAGYFDLIISTVNVKLDWNAYINTLAPKGRLHFVGATLEALDIAAFPLIGGQRSISGSPVGSPATIKTMLEFAARHNIEPVVEHFKFDQVNEAIAHLKEGKARYRVVLSH